MRFFERNCIVKWVIFFASFCWLWDFLLENLILKKTLISTATFERIQKSCMPEIIFSKKDFQTRDFESFMFWSKFRYFGDCFKVFQPVCFFKFFVVGQSWWPTFLFSSSPHPAPTIKELHRAHDKLFLLWHHHQYGCQPRLKRKQNVLAMPLPAIIYHISTVLCVVTLGVYSCQLFKMELFSEIVNVFYPSTIFAKNSILDVLQFSEYCMTLP